MIMENTVKRTQIVSGGFKNKNGRLFAYWYPSNILTSSVDSAANMTFFTEYDTFKLIDVMDGSIYEIHEDMIENRGNGVYCIKDIPVKDTPLLLITGNFI